MEHVVRLAVTFLVAFLLVRGFDYWRRGRPRGRLVRWFDAPPRAGVVAATPVVIHRRKEDESRGQQQRF